MNILNRIKVNHRSRGRTNNQLAERNIGLLRKNQSVKGVRRMDTETHRK